MPTLQAPSGLVGDVRKIKGTELIKLAERVDDTGPDGGFGTVLSGCWLCTTDPGPYSFVQAGDAKPDWSRMLKGDTLYAFVFMRQISMPDGDDYDFDVHCEECRRRYGWTVQLSKLAVKKLPAASGERVRAGEPFEARLPDGRVVRFGLQTIAQEAPITKLMRQQKRQQATMIDALVGQIISIDGVGPDIRARHRAVSDLDMDDLYGLREQFDEHDCGLETSIQTRCTNRECRWEQDVNLPLGRTFFARRRRAREIETDEENEGLATEISSDSSSRASTPSGSGGSSTTSSGRSMGGVGTISRAEIS
jgi:hypothetical protein